MDVATLKSRHDEVCVCARARVRARVRASVHVREYVCRDRRRVA